MAGEDIIMSSVQKTHYRRNDEKTWIHALENVYHPINSSDEPSQSGGIYAPEDVKTWIHAFHKNEVHPQPAGNKRHPSESRSDRTANPSIGEDIARESLSTAAGNFLHTSVAFTLRPSLHMHDKYLPNTDVNDY